MKKSEFIEKTSKVKSKENSAIANLLEGNKDELESKSQTEYINIYWDEWRD